MIDPKLSTLLRNLTSFWWSTLHPDAYRFNGNTGIGVIAKEDYAAFNIAWALHAPLDTREAHVRAIPDFNRARIVLNEQVGTDLMLRDAVTLMSMPVFLNWYAKNRSSISLAGRSLLDRLLIKYQDASNV